MPRNPDERAFYDDDLLWTGHDVSDFFSPCDSTVKKQPLFIDHYHGAENPTVDNVTCGNERVFTARG